MSRPRAWVELCCGSAAVALRLVGGPHANPPIGMMGGKRGYSRVILSVLGLRQGLGADEVWLNDPGPWGAVWACLVTPGKAEEVAAIIRGWQGEEPRALWERLKAEGWGELTTADDAARMMLCGTWSYRPMQPESGFNSCVSGAKESTSAVGNWATVRPITPEILASRVEAVARWLVCQWGSLHDGGPASARVLDGIKRTQEKGGERGPMSVESVASRLRPWPTPVRVYHGSALDVPIHDDCRGVYVYADPSYRHPDGTATTGYAQNIYAEDLRERLLEWSARGAVVCISDARPLGGLMGDGWHQVEIGGERVGQKRTFGNTREWLTLNRPPAWTPGVQVGLFG